jgi:hypothetical protein
MPELPSVIGWKTAHNRHKRVDGYFDSLISEQSP